MKVLFQTVVYILTNYCLHMEYYDDFTSVHSIIVCIGVEQSSEYVVLISRLGKNMLDV